MAPFDHLPGRIRIPMISDALLRAHLIIPLGACKGGLDVGNGKCEDHSTLTFQPAIAADGSYRITVERDGQRIVCTHRIVSSLLDSDYACMGPFTSPITGGQKRLESDAGNGLFVYGTSSVDGLEWQSKSSQAVVTVEKDGALLRTRTVTFVASIPTDDCTGTAMSGTMKLD
jgi:hypothetical protein